jgi:NAD(P)-dependent dehydrogenase (short-subunit alcohol dehydrogenase family)
MDRQASVTFPASRRKDLHSKGKARDQNSLLLPFLEKGVTLMKQNIDVLTQKVKGLVVITGCDSGIGKSLAQRMAQQGYKVAISYLDENHFENNPQIVAQKMDLENKADVKAFCESVKLLCQGNLPLSAVVANAGVALGGPVENLPLDIYRKSFEINFFGAVSIIQALIPELIKSKGKICIIGSMAGRIAMPFLSPYVSTKFALEGFCDSLRREMNPFGVKTILIEPAAVATPIWNKAKEQDTSFVDDKYMDSLQTFQKIFIEDGNEGMAVEKATALIADILAKKKSRARYIIAKNMMTLELFLRLPSIVLDKAVKKMFQMNYGNN